MLSDNKQAIAYAHLMGVIDDWNSLLDTLYDCIPLGEKLTLDSMDDHLTKAIEILEP